MNWAVGPIEWRRGAYIHYGSGPSVGCIKFLDAKVSKFLLPVEELSDRKCAKLVYVRTVTVPKTTLHNNSTIPKLSGVQIIQCTGISSFHDLFECRVLVQP